MKFQEMYRGIVIQNNDPKQSGRVKVFVPGINLTQIDNWNGKKEEDKFFKVLGQNTNSSITLDLLQSQKEKLFWAEVMLPSVGMSSPGYYHAPTDTFYIGNDSDYKFQSNTKSKELFEKDKNDEVERENSSTPVPSYSTSPRSKILLNFLSCGQRSCVNTGCDDSDVPSFVANNNPLSPININLPKVYSNVDLVLDEPEENSIVGLELDVTEPIILQDDKELDVSNPLFNRDCYIPTNKEFLQFSPPIFYEEVDSNGNEYDKVPVNFIINNKKLDDVFTFNSETDDFGIYKNKNLTIKVPKNNVNSIKVKHNKNRFNINLILALLPFLSKLGTLIMPRKPNNKSPRRGGGGGEIYNNVTTSLLPSFQRKDMHVGGANNESRYTVNKGRAPLNDPNNLKGVNMLGNGGQLHRGPMRSPDYSNDWKGLISIPGVGSHVWIRFENGDTNYPIIVGTFASQTDYKGIFQTQ